MAKRKMELFELPTQQLESEIIKLRMRGLSVQSICFLVTKEMSEPEDIIVKAKEVEIICKSFNSYDKVEYIIENNLCRIADSEDYFIYNTEAKSRSLIKPSSLNLLFDKEFLYKKTKLLYDKYDPRSNEIYINENGTEYFNVYTPAPWYEDIFYKRKSITPATLPSIYKEFFTHLVNGDEESYNYLLKWLHNSLVDRNFCYLVTVGRMGVGKGLLYEIASRLHGGNNASHTSGDAFFRTTFNDEMQNKTLYYIDEVSRLSDKDYDRLKMLVNQQIRVEPKYKSSTFVQNYLNVMISSNDLSSLPIPKDDRRFSIITLTTVPTLELWKNVHDDKVQELLDLNNIAQLGNYLLSNVKYTTEEMKVAFKSKTQMREIQTVSMLDWQDYFLFNYCREKAGETIPLRTVIDEVKKGFNSNSIKLSLKSFRALKDKFPGFYVIRAIKRDDKSAGETGLGFSDLTAQPSRADFNLDIVENEGE